MATRKASAVKRGRNPRFPFIPVIVVTIDNGPNRFPTVRTHDTNSRAAFATRVEAVTFAQQWLDANSAP